MIVIFIIITWWQGLCGQTSCLRDRQGLTRSASISQSEDEDDDDDDDDGNNDDDDASDGYLLDMWDLEVCEDIWAVAAADHIVAWRVAPNDDVDYCYYD